MFFMKCNRLFSVGLGKRTKWYARRSFEHPALFASLRRLQSVFECSTSQRGSLASYCEIHRGMVSNLAHTTFLLTICLLNRDNTGKRRWKFSNLLWLGLPLLWLRRRPVVALRVGGVRTRTRHLSPTRNCLSRRNFRVSFMLDYFLARILMKSPSCRTYHGIHLRFISNTNHWTATRWLVGWDKSTERSVCVS